MNESKPSSNNIHNLHPQIKSKLTDEDIRLLEEMTCGFEELDKHLQATNQSLEEFVEEYRVRRERKKWAELKKNRKKKYL